jgi:cell wall-associated NlpC family hydrolase
MRAAAGGPLTEDGWAILALPDTGGRDLGSADLWERSLSRSQRRRERAARAKANLPRSRKVGFAIATTALVAPLAQQTASTANAQEQSTSTTATASSTTSLLRKGDRGPAVSAVQLQLGISADGVFGPQTDAAVRSFQARNGLLVDGIVGPQTRGALGGGSTTSTTSSGSSAAKGPAPSRAVTIALQQKLGLSADGVFGPQSRAAVRSFQASHGLTVDGVVGPATMSAMGISASTQSAPASSGGGGSAVSAARSQIGTPYASGGSQPGGFDCSGLVQWAFKQAGISLPRTSFAQFGVGAPVSRSNIQAGDLVFFNANGPGASHVGLATSNSTAISATTHGVMEHSISDSYWGSHYVGARRY